MQTIAIYLDQSMFSIFFLFCMALLIKPLAADAIIIDSSGRVRDVDQKPPSRKEKKTISIDFYKADIHAVMRFFATAGSTNIILDESIQGTLSMRLEQVSWEEAFTAVLWSKGLIAVPMESMYIVSRSP